MHSQQASTILPTLMLIPPAMPSVAASTFLFGGEENPICPKF
jgi:hypothetical protein